jgi:hypothetical protein
MKLREWIGRRSPETLAALELEDARRSLLEAQSAVEWAQSAVDCYTNRVARLENWLQGEKKGGSLPPQRPTDDRAAKGFYGLPGGIVDAGK